jgi:hypothetical protein
MDTLAQRRDQMAGCIHPRRETFEQVRRLVG